MWCDDDDDDIDNKWRKCEKCWRIDVYEKWRKFSIYVCFFPFITREQMHHFQKSKQ